MEKMIRPLLFRGAFLAFTTTLAAAWLTATAVAQEQQKPAEQQDIIVRTLSRLPFHHYDCPPPDPATEGGSPERPVELEFFSRAWANAAYSDQPDDPPNEPRRFECRWIRLSGFMQWDDFRYPGRLYETPLTSYQRENIFYFIENFAAGSSPRGDLAQRKLTLVAQFYDLCAAGERALEPIRADDPEGRLDLSYPCHEVPAMMLANARVEKIHDAAPQYILGEANRAVLGSLVDATPEQRKEIDPLVREWAALVRKGAAAVAAAYIAQYPKMDDDQKQEWRADISSPDSYQSHLLRQPRFLKLNLKTAPVQVFRPADDDDAFDTAIGCMCLTASCTDRWPLTERDAATFLGDAACIELNRWNNEPWRW